MLFEGGFYLHTYFTIAMGGLHGCCTCNPALRIRMEVQNGFCVSGLAQLLSIALMIMKDYKVVALAMFPMSFPEYVLLRVAIAHSEPRGDRLRSNNYEWVGAGVIRGWILFLSAKAIVRIYYSRAGTIPCVGTTIRYLLILQLTY